MDFHFGQTPESDAFFERNPHFFDSFERLMALANTCLGRSFQPRDRTEDICFSLGIACRQDFLEVLFLAVNGYGIGATKLLRGLFERAVALAYMVKYRDKAERFVRFAAIQEYKLMIAALELVSEAEFDQAVGQANSAAKIREAREMVKSEFQVELCKKCHNRGTPFSWDKDLLTQVKDVGDQFAELYLGSYAIPNIHVHASLASVMENHTTESPTKQT